MDWLMEIYRHNDAKTADRMAAHKDFRQHFMPLINLIRSEPSH